MPRIFRYVVRYDAGTAPRPFDGMCSLAICKPAIRRTAEIGDWVIGFRSRQPGVVVYAMQVTERVTFSEYWEDPRFEARKPGRTNRPDNIYRPARSNALEQVPNHVHGPSATAKDTSGRFVLISNRFWYFGRNSVPIPTELIHLVHSTQGHAVDKHRRASDLQHLEAWLGTWPVGIHGEPIGSNNSPQVSAPASPAPPSPVRKRLEVRAPRSAEGPSVSRRPRPESSGPAKLVLSRKGFDSSYGGMPSPILPDGRLVPLPIPARHDQFRMAHVGAGEELGSLLHDLSKGRHSLSTQIHLDPDLDRPSGSRLPGWRPSLGQTGIAQSHLAAKGVGAGDIFLFFGWFREVERREGRWRFAPSAPDLHVLFGWLEVGELLPVVTRRQQCLDAHPWIADHPHVSNPSHYTDSRNTLYIAPRESSFREGMGGGLLRYVRPELTLTATGRSRSVWRLPRWFHPGNRTPLSYHDREDRWVVDGDGCLLQTVAKGQEFVLDLCEYPESQAWIRSVIAPEDLSV